MWCSRRNCNGRESEEQHSIWRREREKIGRKEKRVDPTTVKIGTHKKIESGFESGLDSKTAKG